MRACRLLPALFAVAVLLGACGPAKVNVRAMALQFDRYKDAAPAAQDRHDRLAGLLAEMLKTTRTPGHRAYTELGAQLERMAGAVRALRDDDQRFHAFKPKFDAYAADKNLVTQEDAQEWARYQSVMAEYNAIRADITRQHAVLAAAEASWDSLFRQYGFGRETAQALRDEVRAARDTVTAGVNEMESGTAEGWRAVDFARKAGGDPVVLASKKEALKAMDELLPAAKLLRATVDLAGQHASRVLRGDRLIWTGPGMPEREGRLLSGVREALVQYKESRQTWDKLKEQFEAAQPRPTPAPSPQPSPQPSPAAKG